jgi:hypothetical protein
MFSLIVGYDPEATVDGSRMLEATPEHEKAYLKPDGQLDPSRFISFPTRLLPEVGSDEPQVARIGRIEHLTPTPGGYRFRFAPSPGVPEIPLAHIESAASALHLGRFETTRTHWAVKDVDLHYALSDRVAPAPAPKVFAFPTTPPEQDLVAVMMPFDASFIPVYGALTQAVTGCGLRCQRADDIWKEDAIMNDIASLIWRSRIVIADLTGKNPNVFYETGMAHTIGRDVIIITQATEDVPFDLRHLRHLRYLSNAEGLTDLIARLSERIRTLSA